MQVVIKYLIYQFYVVVVVFFLACTMLRILTQLWGLCIFLYCYYYGHDNNDITDIIVFSLIKANKKRTRRECWLKKTGLC